MARLTTVYKLQYCLHVSIQTIDDFIDYLTDQSLPGVFIATCGSSMLRFRTFGKVHWLLSTAVPGKWCSQSSRRQINANPIDFYFQQSAEALACRLWSPGPEKCSQTEQTHEDNTAFVKEVVLLMNPSGLWKADDQLWTWLDQKRKKGRNKYKREAEDRRYDLSGCTVQWNNGNSGVRMIDEEPAGVNEHVDHCWANTLIHWIPPPLPSGASWCQKALLTARFIEDTINCSTYVFLRLHVPWVTRWWTQGLCRLINTWILQTRTN